MSNRVPMPDFASALDKSAMRVVFPTNREVDEATKAGAYQAFVRGAGYALREQAENLIAVPKEPDGNSPEAVAYRAEQSARAVLLALIDVFPQLMRDGTASAEVRVLEHLRPVPRALGAWSASRPSTDAVAFTFAYAPFELTLSVRGAELQGSLRHMWELMVAAMAPR